MDTTTTALSCFVQVACAFGGSEDLVVERLPALSSLMRRFWAVPGLSFRSACPNCAQGPPPPQDLSSIALPDRSSHQSLIKPIQQRIQR